MLPFLSVWVFGVFSLLLGRVIPTPVAGLVIPNLDKPGTDNSFFVGAVSGTIAEHFTGAFSCCKTLEWIYR